MKCPPIPAEIAAQAAALMAQGLPISDLARAAGVTVRGLTGAARSTPIGRNIPKATPQERGRKRWLGRTKAERSAHAKMMVETSWIDGKPTSARSEAGRKWASICNARWESDDSGPDSDADTDATK